MERIDSNFMGEEDERKGEMKTKTKTLLIIANPFC
jgi:hypothetical protein